MRGLVRLLILLLAVVAIAWLGLWWYAEGRLELAVDQSVAALRQAGWTVHHGAVTRGTSPLRAEVSVADIRLTPPAANGNPPDVVLPGLVLGVRPAAPLTLDVALPREWTIGLAEGPDLTIHFATVRDRYQFDLKAVLDHDPDPLRAGAFHATGIRVDGANTNFTLVSIASIDAAGTRDPQAGRDRTAVSVHETISGVALSPIFTTLGNLPFGGRLDQLSVDFAMSGPKLQIPPDALPRAARGDLGTETAAALATWQRVGPAVHDWARAGGHGTLDFRLRIGPLDARETGTFGFDDKLQPVAKAQLHADGLDATLGAVASRYPSIVDGLSKLAAAAAPYLTKGPDGRQRLDIRLGLAQGELTANGSKVADVPPVVWPGAGTGK